MKLNYILAAFLCLLVLSASNNPFGQGNLWETLGSAIYGPGPLSVGTTTADSSINAQSLHVTRDLLVDGKIYGTWSFTEPDTIDLIDNTITITKAGYHIIDTEGDVALDTLQQIIYSNTEVGDFITIGILNNTQQVYVDHSDGGDENLFSRSGGFKMDQTYYGCTFFYNVFEVWQRFSAY